MRWVGRFLISTNFKFLNILKITQIKFYPSSESNSDSHYFYQT